MRVSADACAGANAVTTAAATREAETEERTLNTEADNPVQTFAKRALMVDMLLIELYRLTVLSALRAVSEIVETNMREPSLSDLMVNGRLVNNK